MTTPLRMIACVVICACLAIAGHTWAEETASGIVSQTDPAQATTSQTGPATRDRSAALRRVVALRQELQVLVKALARLVAYQKELLALAKTSDVDAVLRARRARQTCLEEIHAAALCDALSVSFTGDDPPDDPVAPLSTSRASLALPVQRRLQASPAEAVDDRPGDPTVDDPTVDGTTVGSSTVQDRGNE